MPALVLTVTLAGVAAAASGLAWGLEAKTTPTARCSLALAGAGVALIVGAAGLAAFAMPA